MKFRFIVSFVFSLLFFSNFVFAECSFTSRDSSCEVFSSPFNSFDLNFENSEDLLDFNAVIYDKANLYNSVLVEMDADNRKVRNVNPFSKAGVYVLDVSARNSVGRDFNFKKEFVFDNLKPSIPIVSLDLDSETSSIEVLGLAEFSKTVVAVGSNGGEIGRTEVLADGTFNLSLNLPNSGLNFVRFYSIGYNGLKSESLDRVIRVGNFGLTDLNPTVAFISLDDNSAVNNLVEGFTNSRNYYVSGNVGVSNSRVFISGNPVESDNNGKFGGFVNLNEGDNEIEVLAGGSSKVLNVKYVNPRFLFTEVNFEKFVIGDYNLFTGDANLDVGFDVFLNGVFVKSVDVSDSSFSFDLTGFKYGKNYVYLKGANGEEFSDIVYFDNVAPKIEVLSSKISKDSTYLYFKVFDEFGVDISKSELILNGKSISSELLEVRGDYYIYDVVFSEGSNSFNLKIVDNSGNSFDVSNNVVVDSNVAIIESVIVESGDRVGDYLFLSEGESKISLVPNKNIAFVKVLLNGEYVTDYTIKQNNEVEMNLNVLEDSGVLSFEFIDSKYVKFSQEFKYEVLRKPQIEFDFVDMSKANEFGVVRVSGNVDSSYFDWESFEIGDNKVSRFGDNFEVVSKIHSSQLTISGRDYLLNEVTPNLFSGVIYKNMKPRFEFNDLNLYGIYGSVVGFTNSDLNMIFSYDGFETSGFLDSTFSLASAQRSGVRSVNLKGSSESGNKFNLVNAVSVDSVKPGIYFLESKIVLLGTLSSIVMVRVDGNNVGTGSSCLSSNDFDLFCRELSLIGVDSVIEVTDGAGNIFSRTYDGSVDNVIVGPVPMKVYMTGNDLKTSEENFFVSGQFVSSSPVSSVSVDGSSCIFDDYNFVCLVSLEDGDNSFTVTVVNVDGESASNSINILKTVLDFDISLSGFAGEKLIDVLEEYYIVDDKVDVLGGVSKEVLVKLVINDKEILKGSLDGDINLVDVDLTEFVTGKDKTELEVTLRAEDEFGNKADSNTLVLIYNRVLETIVDIFIS